MYLRYMMNKIKDMVMERAWDVFDKLENCRYGGERWVIQESDPRYHHRHGDNEVIPTCNMMRWEIRTVSDILEYFAEYTRLWFDAENLMPVHRQDLRDECMMRLMERKAKAMKLRGREYEYMHITEYAYMTNDELDAMRYFAETLCKNPKKKKPLYSPIPNTPMCIADFARKRQLKEQEKILRSAGLKDECGEWTEESVSLFIEQLMDADLTKGKDSFLLTLAKEYLEEKNPKALPAPKKK